MRINLYAQNRHLMTVNGIPLSGFGEGDWMQVKSDGNAAERTKGGDGPAMNVATAQGGQITISLLPTSPALGSLLEMRELQKVNPTLFSLALITGVEEVITATGCAFGDLPQFSTGGPTQGARQFVIECLRLTLDSSAVVPVAGSFI